MDFSGNKTHSTAIYPVHAAQTSGLLKRSEPILTPEKLISRYLKGIPLRFPNGDEYSPEDIKDKINLAMNDAELMLKCPLFRESFRHKVPFDKSLYDAFIHVRTETGPIISVESLSITSADEEKIFEIPAQWIEASNFSKRLINVIPLLAAYGINSVQGAVGNAGIAFLTVMGGLGWVPAYWQIEYTAGLSKTEGQLPIVVNELVGVIAAMEILSSIAPSNIYNSQSLSQDGISQSSSGPGPRLYEKRLEELGEKKAGLLKQLKGIFGSKFVIDNI
jgi:hypothetical protein